MKDILTEEDWGEVTGVRKGVSDKWKLRSEFAEKAGIYHWPVYGGGFATTWTHVYKAGAQPKIDDKTTPGDSEVIPEFDKVV